MKKGVAIILLLVGQQVAFAQTQPKPLPPIIQFITLNPASGIPTISWIAPNFNPLHPNPTGYIIYKRIVDNLGNPLNVPIDTVGPTIFSYTDDLNQGNLGQISYTVASNGPFEPSQMATFHSSIHLTASYDSCGSKLNVRWLHYVGWENRREKYNVYMGTTPDWTSMNFITSVVGSQNVAAIPVEANSTYYLYVEAKKMESEYISKSNITSISTNMARWPLYMSVDSIISENQQNIIHYNVDFKSRLRNYTLSRWEKPDSIASIFSAKQIHQFATPNISSFADTNDSWAARSRSFYYKINAFDGCNRLVRISNLSNSVTLRVISRGLMNTISWDQLYSKNSNRITYSLYRIVSTDYEWPPERILQTDNEVELTFEDDLTPFKGLGFSSQFCYYVEAREWSPANKLIMLSRSRRICVEVVPDIVVPNAIDPLNTYSIGHGSRNLFEPTISFKSLYKITIYNRIGEIVYSGTNVGWDGRMANGSLAREGTYVYRLEVELESTRKLVKTGNLNVVYLSQ
jgi:hypothetical protein